jgi:ribosomal protein S18 acetylase RimI-like enzyme
MKTFRKVLGEQKKAIFDAVYGDKQLNLMVLATHPDYQRRGAGTALLDWGKQKAKEEGLKLTLFSSPQGYKLYRKMGFEEVGVTHIQVDGEEELLDLPMMVF